MKIVRECMARGHKATIYTLRWQADKPADIEVVEVPINGLNRHRQYDNFTLAVQQELRQRQFDLVIGFNKMAGLDVYYAGDPCYIHKGLTQRAFHYRLLPRFKRFCDQERSVFDASLDTQVLCLSDVDIPLFRTYYRTSPDRFHMLPPGIEKDRIAPDAASKAQSRAQVLQTHKLPDDTLLLLFVGSGFIKKGLDRALLAMSNLPDELKRRAHLIVIGRDKGEAFARLSVRLGLREQVTFYLEGRDDIPEFMFAADALVHPAYDETAGMVIIEAMLAGLPALVTHNCGYAKYLNEHNAGIVVHPASEVGVPMQQQIDKALIELLTSPQRKTWAENGEAAKEDPTLFQLVPKAVDLLEQFASNNRPHLVFVLHRYFPHGGLQRDCLRILHEAQSRGYQITVLCMQWLGPRPSDVNIVELEVIANSNHSRTLKFAKQVAAQIARRNVLGVVGFNKMAGLDFYFAADTCFEDKAHGQRGLFYRNSERYRVMSKLEQGVFEKASQTKVMFIAPTQKQQYAKYYEVDDSTSTILPPGVDPNRRQPDNWQQIRAQERQTLGFEDDQLLVLIIASAFRTKGLDRAIEAVADLPGPLGTKCQLLVVGGDNPTEYQRQAARLGVEQNLHFLGALDDIVPTLLAADLMLHPPRTESGGIVLIEALVCGLPVVTTEVCGFAHYIKEARAGVVLDESYEQKALTQQLAALLEDDQARLHMSAAGLDYTERHPELFDMPAQAMNFIQQHLPAHRLRSSA